MDLSNKHLARIPEDAIKKNPNITKLDISKNSIRKIEFIGSLEDLEELDFSFNEITVMEKLESNTALKVLKGNNNKISSIFIRSPMIGLTTLDLSNNPIKGFNGSLFPSLAFLTLNNCNITSITELTSRSGKSSGLLNLRSLSLAGNKLSSSDPVLLPLLSSLDISDNDVTSFSFVAQFHSLAELNISGNPVSCSDSYEFTLEKLKVIKAARTLINTVNFGFAPSLEMVDVSLSKVEDIESLRRLVEEKRTMIGLDTRFNPVTSSLYPPHMFSYKSLGELDAVFKENIKERHDYRFILTNGTNLKWLDGILTNESSIEVAKPTEAPHFCIHKEEEKTVVDDDNISVATDCEIDHYYQIDLNPPKYEEFFIPIPPAARSIKKKKPQKKVAQVVEEDYEAERELIEYLKKPLRVKSPEVKGIGSDAYGLVDKWLKVKTKRSITINEVVQSCFAAPLIPNLKNCHLYIYSGMSVEKLFRYGITEPISVAKHLKYVIKSILTKGSHKFMIVAADIGKTAKYTPKNNREINNNTREMQKCKGDSVLFKHQGMESIYIKNPACVVPCLTVTVS